MSSINWKQFPWRDNFNFGKRKKFHCANSVEYRGSVTVFIAFLTLNSVTIETRCDGILSFRKIREFLSIILSASHWFSHANPSIWLNKYSLLTMYVLVVWIYNTLINEYRKEHSFDLSASLALFFSVSHSFFPSILINADLFTYQIHNLYLIIWY